MYDGVRQRLRQGRGEAPRHVDDGRDLPRRVDLPQLGEAAHLALEVAARPREHYETGVADVGRMDLDERVDELLSEPASSLRPLEARREHGRDDVPVEEPHDVERHAEHVLVLADGDDRRQANAVRRERELESRFADHVVRGRGQWGPRRPPQDISLVAALEEEREVRAAAVPDPLGTNRALTEPVCVEESVEAVEDEKRRALGARRFGVCRDDVGAGGHGAILPGRSSSNEATMRTRPGPRTALRRVRHARRTGRPRRRSASRSAPRTTRSARASHGSVCRRARRCGEG